MDNAILVPVIARNRSGAAWFCELLGSHPKCINGGEISNPFRLEFKDKNRAEVLLKILKNIKCAYVFNYHFHWEERVNDYLIEQKAKVILFDRNPVDTFLSGLLVKQSLDNEDYLTRDGCFRLPHKQQIIEVNVEKLQEFFGYYEFDRLKAKNLFSNLVLEISYEELIVDVNGICRRVLDFIGIEHCKLTSRMVKQETISRRERIINWDDVIRYFKDSAYLHYLKEGADLI